ncbi:MAG TPA: hypothetical protein VMC06_12305 [Opitutaceae bacterium]|nr:hypothetical protein [Opitutaceae bacterium]
MKTLHTVAACLLLLAAIRSTSRSSEAVASVRSPMTFVVMIASPQEEKSAAVLVKSIRAFGGDYSSAPVVLVLADPTAADGRSLAASVQETVVLKMNEKFRTFPFSDKVYACAQVEALVADKTDWLVWLNPDCLVVAPPGAIAADRQAWAALRPVHVQNIGNTRNVGSPVDAPIPEYWERIYRAAGLDPAQTWTVESLVDQQKMRGYFNSGCMAFVPAKGILRAWRDVYESLLSDPASFAFYTSNSPYSIFCHQAVLSAVVMAKAGKSRVNNLAPAYGYPLGLQDFPGFTNRIGALSDLVIVISGTQDNFRKIRVVEPLRSWIDANVK